jgi:hypothetical protein
MSHALFSDTDALAAVCKEEWITQIIKKMLDFLAETIQGDAAPARMQALIATSRDRVPGTTPRGGSRHAKARNR